jgi:PAS domain S-box-containing protein
MDEPNPTTLSPSLNDAAPDPARAEGAPGAARGAFDGDSRVRWFLDRLPCAVAYIDTECRYRFVNPEYEHGIGATQAELAGRQLREVIGDAAWADLEVQLLAALAGESVALKNKRIDPKGNEVWYWGRHFPDFGPDGEVRGVFSVYYDTTKRLVAERLLHEREQALREARIAADKANRLKSQFLANMSHEIRTPTAVQDRRIRRPMC